VGTTVQIQNSRDYTREEIQKITQEEALNHNHTELRTTFAGWTRTLQNSDLDASEKACLSEFCKIISGQEGGHGESIRSFKSTVIT
jgi:hypothetical protein